MDDRGVAEADRAVEAPEQGLERADARLAVRLAREVARAQVVLVAPLRRLALAHEAIRKQREAVDEVVVDAVQRAPARALQDPALLLRRHAGLVPRIHVQGGLLRRHLLGRRHLNVYM
jgi:hypothetical protein